MNSFVGTRAVPISDYASCHNCNWYTSYYAYYSKDGKWRSDTLAKSKKHVLETKHKVEYNRKSSTVIEIMEDEKK